MNLFIIGNGFDVAHNLKTRYCDFKEWLISRCNDLGVTEGYPIIIPEVVTGHHGEITCSYTEALSYIYNVLILNESQMHLNGNWSNFEESLYHLPIEEPIADELFDFQPPLDDDGDPKYSVIQSVAQQYASDTETATHYFFQLFEEWVESISLTGAKKITFISKLLGTDDLFLTFNYTETLESLYKIPDKSICHIHGFRKTNDELIIGHGNHEEKSYNFDEHYFVERKLNSIINALRKDPASNIKKHSSFFRRIKGLGLEGKIQKIYSYGFSFGDVDLAYINTLVKLLNDTSKITWMLNTFDEINHDEYKKKITDCGFKGFFATYT